MSKHRRRSLRAPRHARPQSHCPARPLVLAGVTAVTAAGPLTSMLPAQASVMRGPDNHVIQTRVVHPAMTPAQLSYHHWRHEKHLEHMARLAALAWAARHPAVVTVSHSSGGGDGDRDGDDGGYTAPAASAPAAAPVSTSAGTSYSYAGLEQLWVAAGGSPAREYVAACIAEHESGGRSWAISPTDDWGLWQIHAGGYAMLNPFANAQRAVAMSGDGTNWSPWTTAPMCGV
jgi:Lysozyme like domain